MGNATISNPTICSRCRIAICCGERSMQVQNSRRAAANETAQSEEQSAQRRVAVPRLQEAELPNNSRYAAEEEIVPDSISRRILRSTDASSSRLTWLLRNCTRTWKESSSAR